MNRKGQGPIYYMSGAPRADLAEMMVGLILTPEMGSAPHWTHSNVWCADNGCFTHPERFDLGKYLAWLSARNLDNCLFATAPDIVGNAEATLERSAPVLPMLRDLGVDAALVAQDGLENLTVPWDTFDCLFIGGSTAWKLGEAARNLTAEAKKRGKWVHMGRVNSFSRLKYANDIGCDSADGTYLAFGPKRNLDNLLSWLTELERSMGFGGFIDEQDRPHDWPKQLFFEVS